jgi:acetyl esterase
MYDKTEVEYLRLQQAPEMIKGLPVIVKKSPTEPRPGYFDHDEMNIIKSHWVAREKDSGEKNNDLSPQEMLQKMRDGMGFPNRNLCTEEIITKYETIDVNGNQVGIWRYYLRKSQYRKDRPAFVFLHGGGWVGGSCYTVENPCRLIAELADAVVFNIDYSLAPEKKYPNGFNDCYGAIEHIYKNSDYYGINKTKIAVGGDSAGGNYTAAVSTKDRDNGTHMISLQVLMYACVVMKVEGVEGYHFDIGEYEMSKEQHDLIDPCIAIARPRKDQSNIQMGDLLFGNPEKEAEEPYASPLLTGSYTGLPKLLSIACEYDGLRIQDEEYARRLYNAGVVVKSIRYRGITHAVIDRLGFVPQAEDICYEIADAIKNL